VHDLWLLLTLVLIIAGLAFLLGRRGGRRPGGEVSIHSSVERIRDIGHLSVFKVYTKEIVTETKHDWGDVGNRYFAWVLSQKKMAMVFEFEIDFRYDLRSPELSIKTVGPGVYLVRMPSCLHEVHLQNVRFYDEQQARLLPWLLPDLLNGFFSKGFGEEEKNRLVAAAKQQAEEQARNVIGTLLSHVEDSAKRTLLTICTSLGAREVVFEFARGKEADVHVTYEAAAAP
jgi:hypothetical protein